MSELDSSHVAGSDDDTVLAAYAQRSTASRGRRFAEPPPRHRTEYQRDRDRIVHSTAFRRLVYKTQVFVNHEGDYYRTRLTHTMEDAQITRTMARALRLNADLADHAIEFLTDLRTVAPDKPFFMYYCLGAGHAPHHVEPASRQGDGCCHCRTPERFRARARAARRQRTAAVPRRRRSMR